MKAHSVVLAFQGGHQGVMDEILVQRTNHNEDVVLNAAAPGPVDDPVYVGSLNAVVSPLKPTMLKWDIF